MKALIMGLAALAGVAMSASTASACDAGPLCRNKAALFTDVKAFSQASRCPTLTDAQALEIADLAINAHISYLSYKSVYEKTCNNDTSVFVARDSRVARVFIDVKDMSQASRCPTLNDAQAIGVARDVVENRIALNGFKAVYDLTCNLETATQASSSPGLSSAFLEVKKASQASRCPTLNDYDSITVAMKVVRGENTLSDFNMVYGSSCNLMTALEASRCLAPQLQTPTFRPGPGPMAPRTQRPLRPIARRH